MSVEDEAFVADPLRCR